MVVEHTFEFPFRNSSLKLVKHFNKLAFMPLGGSTVILEPFCSTGTGKFGLGILVSHNLKSL